MKKSYETEYDMLEFRDMLLDHMAENYPGVTLPAETVERRSRLAAVEFENPKVPITQAMDNAMSVLLKGYEQEKKQVVESAPCGCRVSGADARLQARMRCEILALCEPELRRISRRAGFEQTEEYSQLKSLLLPLLSGTDDLRTCN